MIGLSDVAHPHLRRAVAVVLFGLTGSCDLRRSPDAPPNERRPERSTPPVNATATSWVHEHDGQIAGDGGAQPDRKTAQRFQKPFVLRVRATPLELTFVVNETPEGRVICSLVVRGPDALAHEQNLVVHDMEPVPTDEDFVVGGQDINFDGYSDLSVVTRTGTSNVYADYWIFSPVARQFDYLGNFPSFRLDSRRRRLSTDENIGHAGREYRHNDYSFIAGALVMLRSERQEVSSVSDTYERTTSVRSHGALRVVKRQHVKVR
jgi:hypothetical protein